MWQADSHACHSISGCWSAAIKESSGRFKTHLLRRLSVGRVALLLALPWDSVESGIDGKPSKVLRSSGG